jgi:hypothetical protein
MKEVLETIKPWVEGFKNLSDENKNLIVKLGLITTGAGPVVLIFGEMIRIVEALTKAFNFLNASMAGNLFIKSGGIFTALAIALVQTGDSVLDTEGKFIDLQNTINGFGGFLGNFNQTVKDSKAVMQELYDEAAKQPELLDSISLGIGDLIQQYRSKQISIDELLTKLKELQNGLGDTAVSMAAAGYAASSLKNHIDSLQSKEITVTTNYVTVEQRKFIGNVSGIRQSGGIANMSHFAEDLNIPIFKGEAVLPAPLVKAIKEGRGSFAGLSSEASSKASNININFNQPFYLSNEVDIDTLTSEMANQVKVKLAGVGIK